LGFDAGDGNLYRYVGNRPGLYVDPQGLGDIAPGEEANRKYYYRRFVRAHPMSATEIKEWMKGWMTDGWWQPQVSKEQVSDWKGEWRELEVEVYEMGGVGHDDVRDAMNRVGRYYASLGILISWRIHRNAQRPTPLPADVIHFGPAPRDEHRKLSQDE